jgi:hypothetical protein
MMRLHLCHALLLLLPPPIVELWHLWLLLTLSAWRRRAGGWPPTKLMGWRRQALPARGWHKTRRGLRRRACPGCWCLRRWAWRAGPLWRRFDGLPPQAAAAAARAAAAAAAALAAASAPAVSAALQQQLRIHQRRVPVPALLEPLLLQRRRLLKFEARPLASEEAHA